MSNIYINEPPTHGKVLLRTSVGDLDIELWSREAPKACRNFIQLCLEGYYDNTIFHRLVKGFIVQGGDPTGTGMGGESVYGEPFKDEFHSRLRFVRRGLCAMANSGTDDNGSQFFFTLNACPELQSKHTIFGKITGNTLYNMLKLEEGEVDQNERPLYPNKIISTQILSNPFDDIIPRETKKKVEEKKTESKREVKASKNFSLLSFGDEAEEDEEEVSAVAQEFRGKSKSSHDLLKNDPKLSALPAVDESELNGVDSNDESDESEAKSNHKKKDKWKKLKERFSKEKDNETAVKEDEDLYANDSDAKERQQKEKICKIKDEFRQLKKQMLSELKKKKTCESTEEKKLHDNPHVAAFIAEAQTYREACKQMPKKGCSREQLCLTLLDKFKSRLMSTRERKQSKTEDKDSDEKEVHETEDLWLAHEFNCKKEEENILAKDANMRDGEDWYDIYDPRNPINKRRREAGIVEKPKKSRVN